MKAKYAKILDDLVVVVDTREKENKHILKFFNDHNIKYKIEKVEVGDYSVDFPTYQLDYEFLNRGINVERKSGLSEIATNFSFNRDRFAREFERLEKGKIQLVIEDNTWGDVLLGNYKSEMKPNALAASLISWSLRYNCQFWIVPKDQSGSLIYRILYYGAREMIKEIEIMETF